MASINETVDAVNIASESAAHLKRAMRGRSNHKARFGIKALYQPARGHAVSRDKSIDEVIEVFDDLPGNLFEIGPRMWRWMLAIPGGPHFTNLPQPRLWKRISETERDEVGRTILPPMGERLVING